MTEEVVGVKEVEGRLLYECDKIESVCLVSWIRARVFLAQRRVAK